MKTKMYVALLTISLLAGNVQAQGTFQYDQQSADENNYLEGTVALGSQPLGQSFMPSLASIGFIRIYLSGGVFGDGTFYLNLRSDSITGPILASTVPVTVTLATAGPVNFIFDNPVSVSPGNTYFFQPVVQSGGGWGTFQGFYNYAGGTAIFNGVPDASGRDLWFREGIVVPEPTAASLVFCAGVAAALFRRKLRNTTR